MKKLGKINTSQIKDQVYDQLRKRILNGTWEQDSKLPSENQLCEQLGVSRVSVRSALQSLEAQGYIEIRRGEGSFVNRFNLSDQLERLIPIFALDKTDVMDVLEYRTIIEPNIIPLVVERITDTDLSGLQKIYDKMEASCADIRKFALLDEQFHLRLVDIISNNVIQKVYTVLFEIFNASWFEICEVLGTEDGLHYHKELIEALRSRDVVRSTDLMTEHIQRTYLRMNSYYRDAEASV